MTQTIPCTVQILTRNSMPGIKQCLDALTVFDEVMVQDGYSTDGTREVAAQYPNVRIIDQNKHFLSTGGRIIDFSSMRNESLGAAKHDWIFVVDSDEQIDQSLVDNVSQIVGRNTPGVYNVFRRFTINGERMMHCSAYPALQIRLFHRSLTEGFVKPVHERLKLKPGVSVQMLDAELLVPLPPAADLQPKYDRYLRMEVERQGTMPWGRWLKWVLWRNLRSMLGLSVRLLWIWATPRTGKRLPLAYEFQFIAHSWRTIWATFPGRITSSS